MIRIHPSNGGVIQTITTPSVYLDHWALRQISESDDLAKRFTKALVMREGTLVLSWLNVVEFSKVADDVQRGRADELLKNLGVNVFWINPDFFTVGKLEVANERGLECDLVSDSEMAKLHVDVAAFGLKIPNGCLLPGVFTAIYSTPEIRQQCDELADDMVEKLMWLRSEFNEKTTIRSAIKSPPKSGNSPRGTRLVARHLIGRLLKDQGIKLSRNNAIDLTHTVVAVSYCDLVLLDTQWATMVREMQRDFDKHLVQIPIAKVFSKRSNGVEEFLKRLEGDNKS